MRTRTEILEYQENGILRNPDLNFVLSENIELFNHAFLQKHTIGREELLVCIEPYDRELTHKDVPPLCKLIRAKEKKLLKTCGGRYLEIEVYI